MKIVIFTETYKPVLNGVVTATLNLRVALEKKGHKVYIFTSGKIEKEKNVFSCPNITISQGCGPVIPYFKEKEILKDADIYHTQQPFVLGCYAMYYAKKYNKPLVATIHTQYHNYTHYVPVIGAGANVIVCPYLSWFFKGCDKVILLSKSLKQTLSDVYKVDTKKMELIPNSLNFTTGANLKNVAKLKKKFKLEGKRVLIFVGRIGKEKNIEFLIEAFKKINSKDKNTFLFVVGDGPELGPMKKLVQKKNIESIHFTGNILNKKVFEYLSLADLFVSSSKTENHPITLLEAMYSSVVPVTLRTPGFVDTISNGKDGVLVGKEDTEKYSNAVVKLLANGKLLKKMKTEAHKKAMTYDAKINIEKTISLYKSLLRKN